VRGKPGLFFALFVCSLLVMGIGPIFPQGFVSEPGLIPDGRAVEVPGWPRIGWFEIRGQVDDKRDPDDIYPIRWMGSEYQIFATESLRDPILRLRFIPTSNGKYAMQWQWPDFGPKHAYWMVEVRNGVVVMFKTRCDMLTQLERETLGLKYELDRCPVTSLDQLLAVVAAVELHQPAEENELTNTASPPKP
jgi:hypothetical protein